MNWDFGSYGFTGTRKGMTKVQARHWIMFMHENGGSLTEFHHGCAVGADQQANELMVITMPWVRRVGHPCNIWAQQAHGIEVNEMLDELPPLQRNDVIVKSCQVLTACPGEEEEVLRSGTWSTIRKAMKTNLVVIFFPSGRVEMNRSFAQDEGKRLI